MERRDRSDSDIAQRKIFIGGLSYGTDDDKLRKYFSVYGTVQDAVVMKDPVSRRSRGFGFITFTDINSVDNTLANEPHTIDARKVEAKRAVPRSESRDVNMNMNSTSSPSVSGCKTAANRSSSTSSDNSSKSGATQPPGSPVISVAGDPTKSPSHAQIMSESKNACDPRIAMDEYAYNKIFVGGLHYDTRDAEFKQYFEKFGKVISAEVMFNRETHKSRGFGFIVFEQENGAELVCQEREHVIDGKVVEVKRAIPRSRITPNGTILPPPVSSTGIAGRTGHNLSGQPLIRSMSGGPGGVNSGMNGIAKGGTGQLIRPTDAKRSMSMGGAPNSMGTMGGLNHSSPMKTGMNIGVQGQPRPKVTTGASYAAALKLGGGTDDNEGSLTDLLLGSVDLSLAKGPPGNQLGLNMDGNNSLHTNGIAMRATGMAIERPSRSSSFSDQLGPSANPTNNPSFNGMSPASNPSPLISNNNATGTSNLSSNSHTMQSTSGQSLNSLGNLAQWLSTPPTKPIASMETVAGATGQQQQEMFPPLQLPSSSSGPSMGSVLGGVGPGQDSFLGFARPLVAPQGANMGMGQPGPYQHQHQQQQQQHQQQQQYMGGQPQQQPFMGIPGQGLNPHQPEYHQHQHQQQQQQQQQQQHHQQGGYMPQQQQQYQQQQQQQYQQQPQFHPQQQQQHQQQQGVMNQQYQQQYPPMPNSNHMQQQPLQQPPPSLGAWASMVANSSGHNNGEGGPMRNQPPPHPSQQQQQQQQQYYDQQQQQAFHQAAGGHPQNFQHNQPPTDHTNNVGQGPNHYNHHQQQQGYPPLQPPSQQQQQQQSNSSGYPPSQGPGNNMYPSQPVAQPPSGPAQGQGPAGYPPSNNNNNNNNNVAINSDNTTTNQQQQSPQVNAPGFYNQSPPSTSLSPSMQPQQPGFSGLPAPGGIAFNAQLPSPHYSPLGYASVNGNVTNGGVGLGLVLEAQQMDLKHPSHGLIGSTTRGSRSESFGMRPDADSAGTILSGGGTGTGTTSRESRSESFSQSNASAGMSGGSTLSSHSSYAVNGSNNGGVVNGMNNGSSTESPRLSSLSLSTLPGAGNVGNGDSGSSLGGLAFEELKLDVAAPEFAPNGSTGPGQLSKGPPRLSAWGVPH